jgi:hypothetical protein
MLSLVSDKTKRYTLAEAINADVSRYLYESFSSDDGLLANLDRWTQRRITLENLAKIELVLEAEDSVEHCYQILIREIDNEAETGIYVIGKSAGDRTHDKLMTEPGISGELCRQVATIAPKLFPDALAHSDDQLDLVWITIRARYERARVEAEISRIAMGYLMDNADVATDMADAVRALMYAFHEDASRRHAELPLLLNERETRELVLMVSELEKRAGNYVARSIEISERAQTH